MSRLRKRILAVLILSHIAALAVSVAYTLLFVGTEGGDAGIFACRFKELFNLYCPGCGGSRSLYYFLTFDFVRSFIYCPAILVTVVILLDIDVRAVIAFVKDDLAVLKRFHSWAFIIIPAVLLLNFAVRNILLLHGVDYLGDVIGGQ